MKRLAAVAGLALALIPAAASAQSVNVTVTVAATASGSAVSALAFGSLAPGASLSINPGHTNGATTIGAVEITHSGNFSVAGPASATLTGAGADLSVTLSCQYRDAASAGTGLAPTAGAAVACNAIPNWTTGGNTNVFVQVGGSITIPAAQTSGAYSGTASFTVTAL